MQGAFVNDGATNNFFDSAQTDEGAVFDLLIILRDVVSSDAARAGRAGAAGALGIGALGIGVAGA